MSDGFVVTGRLEKLFTLNNPMVVVKMQKLQLLTKVQIAISQKCIKEFSCELENIRYVKINALCQLQPI